MDIDENDSVKIAVLLNLQLHNLAYSLSGFPYSSHFLVENSNLAPNTIGGTRRGGYIVGQERRFLMELIDVWRQRLDT